MIRTPLSKCLLSLSLLFVFWTAYAQSPQQRFETLMRDLLILDSHIDTPGYIVDEGYQLAEEHRYYETDIPRLRRGKVGAVFFGIYVQPQDFPPERWLGRALEWVDAVHQEVRRNANHLELAYTADDIERIQRSGKIATLLSLEGGHIIQDSLPVMRNFYRLGVRYMTLAHFRTNNWADSGTDKPVHNGLSGFGREVVREMNRLGMMVDISHVSDKTFYDVLETTQAPVIASHSSLRAVCDIPRNMNDDMLRALAKNGGVVFLNFNAAYLDRAAYDVFDPLRSVRDAEIKQMMEKNSTNPARFEMKRDIQKKYRQKLPKVDVSTLLRHIDHAVKVMGADHVGMGSDFDGISGMTPEGMEDVSKYPDLVKGLIQLGYSDTDIRKIMGQNMLRVMRANEAVSKKMAASTSVYRPETKVSGTTAP
jgi:membrane dipeptidase